MFIWGQGWVRGGGGGGIEERERGGEEQKGEEKTRKYTNAQVNEKEDDSQGPTRPPLLDEAQTHRSN